MPMLAMPNIGGMSLGNHSPADTPDAELIAIANDVSHRIAEQVKAAVYEALVRQRDVYRCRAASPPDAAAAANDV